MAVIRFPFDAEIGLSFDGQYLNVWAKTSGACPEHAQAGAQMVLDAFAGDQRTLIRSAPDATADTNFDTGVTEVRGYVRFGVVVGVKGEREHPSEDVTEHSFGVLPPTE